MKVYVCSNLQQENFDYVEKILRQFMNIQFLRPTPDQLLDKAMFINYDVHMIEAADEVWVLGKYGRDCSWEMGYATGKDKPLFIIKDETNQDLIEDDWMQRFKGIICTLEHLKKRVAEFTKSDN